jgi:CubicO group peptidase (beta-lactamase class C family)
MPVLPRLIRYTRKAAFHAGLVGRSCEPLAGGLRAIVDDLAPPLMREHNVPGLSVLVLLPDGSRVERCLGVADAGTGAPMAPDTVFQVMSVTKPVTALGVLRLAEKRILDLDTPVEQYLRSWTLPLDRRHAHDFSAVTLRRILSHTAGFNVHGFLWAPPDAAAPTTTELLDGIEGPEFLLRLVHPPGERFHYSGGGYTLVQKVIEDVTGRPFADVMRDEVFIPLALRTSSFAETETVRAALATRHDEQARPLPRALCAAHAPTGLYSTPRDLAALWSMMYAGPAGEPPGGGFISEEAARAMTTPHSDPAGERVCGLGFFLWRTRSDCVFSHAGFKQGWWCQAISFLRRRCTLVVCSNADSGAACVKPLCTALRQHIFDHAL